MIDSRYRFEYFQLSSLQKIARDIYACKMPRYKPARLFTHENWHFKLHIGIRYLSSKKYIQKYIFFLSNELKILSASYTTCFFILSVEKKKKRKKRKKKKERKDGEALARLIS